jgi:uncharacterized membrane protein YbhN (UPF0104 family)
MKTGLFLLKVIAYLSLVALVLFLCYYYGQDIIAVFKKFPLWVLACLVLLQIPAIAAGGLTFDCLTKPYDIHLQWKDWVGLSFIANMLNQFLPYRPGMGFRYLYLRHHYQMKAHQFITIMLVYLVINLLVSTAFSLVGWSQIKMALPKEFNQFFVISVGVGIAIFALWLWLKKTKPLKVLHPLLEKPATLLKALVVLAIMNLLNTLIFSLVFWAVGAPLPLSHCLFLVGILTIAMVFPLTPGNIGVLEMLSGTLTLIMYKDFGLGFSAVVLYRASQWIPSVTLGSIFSFLLLGSFIPRFHYPKLGSNKMG